MKKIDFTKLKIEASIGEFKESDLAKIIGNALFQVAPNIEMSDLARKIHSSDGEISISNEDFSQMTNTLDGVLTFRIKEAIRASVKNCEGKMKKQ